MALTIWQNLTTWVANEVIRASIWSFLSVLLAVLTYAILRRKILSSGAPRKHSRLLAMSVLFVLLFVLVRVWTGVLFAGAGEPAGRVRTLLEKSLWTFGVAAAIYILVTAARHAFIKSGVSIEARHKARMASSWIGIVVFVIAAAFIWVSGIQDFGIFLGIVGAGVALSLQETLVCIAGWVLLVVRRPFDIGDRIEIDKRVGDVIGVSVFQTSMMEVGNWVKADQSTGRMLIIPNSMLIRHPVYNYSKGFPFIWNELSTVVTFESDWEQAEKLLLEKAEIEADKIESEVKRRIEQMQSQYAIRYEHLRPIVYTNIADNGVELTLRYISPVRQRRATAHRISRNILHAFLENPRIDFAYPTTRIFRNTDEGKPGTGGPPARQQGGVSKGPGMSEANP
ncbi:MAG: mechanosensitive ion channel family protein [Planctomycetota bacterium]|nr:mechanosensitive ion channel family protein [Planctomycetota bacterium]